MCGRYANSRRPEDLVEEFEIERTAGPGPGAGSRLGGPDFNVAPTKPALVVLRRQVKDAEPQAQAEQPDRPARPRPWTTTASPPSTPRSSRPGTEGAAGAAHASPAHLGPGALLGEGPVRRQPDDQRPRRLAARQAGLPARGARPALPGPRRRLVRVAEEPRRRRTPRASRASSRSGSTPPSTGRSPSRGCTSSGATRRKEGDDAWLTTFTIVTTEAEPGLDVIHDRMPFVVPEDRWAEWLDPERHRPGRRPRPAPAAGAGPVRRDRGHDPGQRRVQQRPGAARAGSARPAPRRRRPGDRGAHRCRRSAALLSGSSTPRRARRGCTSTSRTPTPSASLVLGHGAGGGVGAPDLRRRHGRSAAAGWRVVLVEQPWHVAGRQVAVAPPRLDEAWLGAPSRAVPREGPLVVGGRSAGRPGRLPDGGAARRGRRARAGVPAAPARAPDRSRAGSWPGAGVPAWSSCRASATRSARRPTSPRSGWPDVDDRPGPGRPRAARARPAPCRRRPARPRPADVGGARPAPGPRTAEWHPLGPC